MYILGAGAIGSIFGAFLSQKNQVTLIGRARHM
ncbi:MAG: 2-dehydropantoate 2-reductase N-terminal domain-containing protein, partial [Candidatus Hermodarchaeota archaeon]|nr:2-dehydropantoate 2-reductase N-terminal domain-containing protein [Candidatus Hermodarchaeota archaeon]